MRLGIFILIGMYLDLYLSDPKKQIAVLFIIAALSALVLVRSSIIDANQRYWKQRTECSKRIYQIRMEKIAERWRE